MAAASTEFRDLPPREPDSVTLYEDELNEIRAILEDRLWHLIAIQDPSMDLERTLALSDPETLVERARECAVRALGPPAAYDYLKGFIPLYQRLLNARTIGLEEVEADGSGVKPVAYRVDFAHPPDSGSGYDTSAAS